MIKMIRLDERMIHGQIAVKWSKFLGVNRIIVANDEAASNEIIKQSLMMAVPASIKAAIVSTSDLIAMMQNPKAASYDILIIVANPSDLLKAVENLQGIQLINVGNYGRTASSNDHLERKRAGDNLYVTEDEKEIFKKIIASGIKTVYQTTPDEPEQDLAKII